MKSSTLHWAIVGPGHIARKFAKDLHFTDGGRLHSIASRDLARARAFADDCGAAHAFDDLHALAADPTVDLVYIATPHPAHFETAKLLLKAGKPVLCEKPLTVNAEQARELIAISRAKRVFLMEAMWTRCLPIFPRVREWLDAGRIGRPTLVSSHFHITAPQVMANRWFNPELAGGSLLDLGVYNLAVSQWVMGRKPDQVAAVARFSESGVDEFLAASLHYPHGGLAQISCGLSGDSDNSLVISGERGFIRLPPRFLHAAEATLHTDGKTESVSAPLRSDGFEFEIDEAMRCFRNGEIESPLMPHADTLATMETMDEIRHQIGLSYPGEGTRKCTPHLALCRAGLSG